MISKVNPIHEKHAHNKQFLIVSLLNGPLSHAQHGLLGFRLLLHLTDV